MIFEHICEGVFSLAALEGKITGALTPYEYTGWRDEVLASKDSAYLSTGLLISPVCEISGPDSEKFLSSVCVNNFTNSKVGGLRHAVMCDEKGRILTDGVSIKLSEDRFRLYYLSPVIDYYVSVSDMDIKLESFTGREFFLQLAGPKSLEILEEVCGESLRDIRFARHRMSSIAGVPCRIVRLGMAGTLAYEVHGEIDDLDTVYDALWEATRARGGRKLGIRAYSLNHTEGGFPNINMHYPLPWYETPGLREYMLENSPFDFNRNRGFSGSLGDDLETRFRTPYDVGWGFLVKFDHEFTGKAALEKIAENPPYTVATLEWNTDDVADVYASQLRGRDVEPYMLMDEANDMNFNSPSGKFIYHTDKVFVGDEMVGVSAGRTNSAYYRRMISLAFVDPKYAVEGTEMTVLWGSPEYPQKKIRATVARFPYMDLPNNSSIDVTQLP